MNIKSLLKEAKLSIIKLKDAQFFYIFGSNVWSLALSFLSSIFVVRYLEKSAYGVYSIASNLYSYFALFIGLGLTSGILQYCSEKREDSEKGAIYHFAFKFGNLLDIIIAVAIVVSSCVGIDSNPDVNKLLLTMCIIPIFTNIASFYSTYARIKRNNKLFALVNVAGSTFHFVLAVITTRLFSIYGYIISLYFQQIITVIIYFIYYQKNKQDDLLFIGKPKTKLSRNLKKEIIKYSFLCCITNVVSCILSLLDVSCLNRILNDATVIASYKVAMAIPSALMFIPTSFILFMYPYWAENSENPKVLNRYVLKSLILLVAINGVVCSALFVGAEFIVNLLWGQKYADAVPVFRILIVNYFIGGTFRRLYGNVLSSIKKVKINLYNAVAAGVLNIILNIVLILKFNSVGAALATLIVTIFTAVVPFVYYQCWLKRKTACDIQ